MTEETDGVKSPRDRFLTVAPGRVQKVLDSLELLGKCGARKSYEFTEAEVEDIHRAVTEGVVKMLVTFDPVRDSPKFTFHVPDQGESPTLMGEQDAD